MAVRRNQLRKGARRWHRSEWSPEGEAAGDVRAIYEEVKQQFGIDFVPNLYRVMATVSELVEATGFLQGTLSKHLQTLDDSGFVRRRRDGQFVNYALANPNVLALCEQMCGRIEDEADAARPILRGRAR